MTASQALDHLHASEAAVLRFSANISTLFADVPFLERCAAARAAGFEAIECQFPYDVAPDDLRARLDQHDLHHVLLNAPAGDWAAGERGLATASDAARFAVSIEDAARYATIVGCPRVHVLAGLRGAADPWTRVIERMRAAADRFAVDDLTLLVEALNPHDVPGYLVADVPSALALVEAIDRPNVELQFDLYHAQWTEPDALACLRASVDRVGHVQVASFPDRAEPGVEYAEYWQVLEEANYRGWVGAEYVPRGRTEDGLGWFTGRPA